MQALAEHVHGKLKDRVKNSLDVDCIFLVYSPIHLHPGVHIVCPTGIEVAAALVDYDAVDVRGTLKRFQPGVAMVMSCHK